MMRSCGRQTGGFELRGLGLLGAMLLPLLGCPGPAVPPIPAPQKDAPELSEALDFNVYLDGSGSIRHFLETAPAGEDRDSTQPNYFKDLLDKAETTLHNAPASGRWKDARLRFFLFGSGRCPKPLPSNGGLQQMSTQSNRFSEGDTQIETPIQANSPGSSCGGSGDTRPEVKIIITDLYQSNGQLEKPADALADKYLRGDTEAVGVLAVRNPFSGSVEDLPGTPRGKTLPGAADSMPFYVIAAGPAADARHALEVLVKGTGLDAAMAKGLATEFFFSRAARATPTSDMKFSEARYSKITSDYNGQHIPLLELISGKLKMNWTDPFDAANHTVPLGDETLRFSAARLDPKGALTDDPDAAKAAAACGGSVFLCATIDRTKLAQGRTYVFRMDRVASQPADTLQPDSPALRTWNIEVPEAERISRSPRPVFPSIPGLRDPRPGLTPDLSKFLKALQGQMFHDQVRLTSYYVYVQAK